jgi:NADH:ubiquinone oxidoreductase subunit 5 (subunit L)/multisubunit Na+/H+ antiporter MnhA subunit
LSYIITAFSLVGVPPLSGFYAKWLLFNTVYQFMLPLGGILASVLALLFLVFMPMATSIYLIRSFHKIFMGQSPENIRVDEVHFTMWLPTIVLAAIAILVGFQPNLLLNLISTG